MEGNPRHTEDFCDLFLSEAVSLAKAGAYFRRRQGVRPRE
jgi:hypothetical protein